MRLWRYAGGDDGLYLGVCIRRRLWLIVMVLLALVLGSEVLLYRYRQLDYDVLPDLRFSMGRGDLKTAFHLSELLDGAYCMWIVAVACDVLEGGASVPLAERNSWNQLIVKCLDKGGSETVALYKMRYESMPNDVRSWAPPP